MKKITLNGRKYILLSEYEKEVPTEELKRRLRTLKGTLTAITQERRSIKKIHAWCHKALDRARGET